MRAATTSLLWRRRRQVAPMRRWRAGCARATPVLARMESSFLIAILPGARTAIFFCGCSTRMAARRSYRAMERAAWRRGWRIARGCGRLRWARWAECGGAECFARRARFIGLRVRWACRGLRRGRLSLPGVGAVDGAVVHVGNPHFVLFVEREDFGAHGMSWQALGAKISASPLFAQGTNVEFVQVRGAGEIAFRIFERGCGPTMSSGTGTCASSAAAMFLRGTNRELTAIAEGGSQRTVWPANDAVMRLTGPAEIVCRGEAFLGNTAVGI